MTDSLTVEQIQEKKEEIITQILPELEPEKVTELAKLPTDDIIKAVEQIKNDSPLVNDEQQETFNTDETVLDGGKDLPVFTKVDNDTENVTLPQSVTEQQLIKQAEKKPQRKKLFIWSI